MKLFRKIPYWQFIAIPLLLIFSGVFSNQLVLVANWGKFPVMVNQRQVELMQDDFDKPKMDSIFFDSSIHFTKTKQSKLKRPKYPVKDTEFLDDIHSIMGHNSNLKGLADWINLGDAIYSPGDLLLELGEWLFAFTPLMWLVLILCKLVSLNS